MGTQAAKKNGTTTIKGDNGKIVDNIANTALDGPTQNPTVDVKPKTTGKVGTDIPPLVVEIPSKWGRSSARFYVKHPDHKEDAIRLGQDAAVDQMVAFPSITSCIGALDKPALVPWAVGLTADAAEERFRELQNMDPWAMAETVDTLLEPRPGDRSGRTNLNVELRQAHKDNRDSAAVRGTEVHAICEAIAQGETPEVPDELAGYVAAYLEFREQYPTMQFEWTEVTVAGPGYMGTADAIVTVGNKRYVLDLKTNKKGAVYESVGLQLAAAANADMIVHSDGQTEPMPAVDGGIAIGLAPDGKWNLFKFETNRGGANHNGFLATVQAWNWKRKTGGQPKPLPKGAAL